jgi:hypothetical protein
MGGPRFSPRGRLASASPIGLARPIVPQIWNYRYVNQRRGSNGSTVPQEDAYRSDKPPNVEVRQSLSHCGLPIRGPMGRNSFLLRRRSLHFR